MSVPSCQSDPLVRNERETDTRILGNQSARISTAGCSSGEGRGEPENRQAARPKLEGVSPPLYPSPNPTNPTKSNAAAPEASAICQICRDLTSKRGALSDKRAVPTAEFTTSRCSDAVFKTPLPFTQTERSPLGTASRSSIYTMAPTKTL